MNLSLFNRKLACIVFVLLLQTDDSYALCRPSMDTTYLIHIFDYDYYQLPREQNGTHNILFRRPVTYIINKKDTLSIEPVLSRRLLPSIPKMVVYAIPINNAEPPTVRFIADEYGLCVDTTFSVEASGSIPMYFFLHVNDKMNMLLRKKLRVVPLMTSAPLSNSYLHSRIMQEIKSGKRIIPD